MVNFLEQFVATFKPHWFLRWLPLVIRDIVAKLQQVPRVGKLYTFLKTGLIVAQKEAYFEKEEPEVLATKNSLLAFCKQLIVRQQEYQDELLKAVLDMLLHVPVAIIHEPPSRHSTSRLHLWHPVLLKTIELGLTDNDFGAAAVDVLDLWLSELPHREVFSQMGDVFPKLAGYLCVGDEDSTTPAEKNKPVALEEQHLNDQFWRSTRSRVTRR